MELLVEFDPPEGATHRIRWDVLGPPGDWLAPDAGVATTARLVRGPGAAGAGRWLLRSEVASPIADNLSLAGVVQLFAYLPYDYDAILDFDRRITARYTEFCASTGEYYAGTVACDAWEPGWLGELVWYDLATIEESTSIGTDVTLPDDIRAIVTECRDMQDLDRTRHLIHFEPLRF